MSNVKFFQELGDASLVHALCAHISLQVVPANHLVCVQGDEGSTFYIVYSGAVRTLCSFNPSLS